MTSGEKIDALAKSKGMNMHQLSIAAKVSYSTVYSIIRRKSNMVDWSILNRIAIALGVSPSAIAGDGDIDLHRIEERAEQLRIEDELREEAKNMIRSRTYFSEIPFEIGEFLFESEDALLETVHRICGMDYSALTDCIANNTFYQVFCPAKIDAVRSFIEDNEKTLKKIIEAGEKGTL